MNSGLTSHQHIGHSEMGWVVGCFGFNGPLRQYFSLYARSTIFRLNIYGGCTNQVYFRAGEGTKFM